MADDYTNRSGTIAAPSVSQSLAPALRNREGFVIQNISDTEMWINDLGAASAAAGSWKIPAGAMFVLTRAEGLTGRAITIFCTAAGKAFTAREW